MAVGELYDGRSRVPSVVDNRGCRRLTFRVPDHAPKAGDVAAFLKSFKRALDGRGPAVKGATTDGSSLCPGRLALVFAGVPHQACSSHVIRALTEPVLHALARVRRAMRSALPPMPKGRPSGAKAEARLRRRAARARARVADLFEHRHAFVTHHLTPARRRTPRWITRGPTPGKALVFLADKLLPSTPNAVERGDRRPRKMQKTVYRVRTQRNLERRMALDLLREMHAVGRERARQALHRGRSPDRFKAERQSQSVTKP